MSISAIPVEAAFLAVVAAALAHLMLFAVLAHVRQGRPRQEGPRPFIVFIIPCLNEELVIGRSLDKLLALPRTDFAVLVVDDGSADGTPDVVTAGVLAYEAATELKAAQPDQRWVMDGYDPERVWLLRRKLPEARKGKGAALNHAYRHLQESSLLAGRDARDVVVAVLDADGRLQPNALDEVTPLFQRPHVGAVQVGVRMYNAHESLLARMQDMEFVVFTEIFQRARRHLGSVGLGGNGQFVRLAALQSLEHSPWTDCLTEDLDLGIRLRLHGWLSEYTGATWVEQQAVTTFRRLIRQRARWFRGHLQCSRLIPLILRTGMPVHTTLDLCWHLMGPVTILLMSLWSATFLTSLAYLWITDPVGSWQTVSGQHSMLPVFYGLSMAPALLYGAVYWRATAGRHSGSATGLRALALAHLFTIYGYLWFVAGWRAVTEILRRKHGWAKTARTADAAPSGLR